MTGIKDTRKGCTNRGTGGHKMHRNLKEGRSKTRQDKTSPGNREPSARIEVGKWRSKVVIIGESIHFY